MAKQAVSKAAAGTATRFQKGRSGNPGGRPKGLADVEAQARGYTNLALTTLARICRSTKAPEAAQVAASRELLSRAWGNPKQAVEATMTFDLAEVLQRARERVDDATDSSEEGEA